MKLAILTAIFLVQDCSYVEPEESDSGVDSDTTVAEPEDDYPGGPYCWRAAVRVINGDYLYNDAPCVLPEVVLYTTEGDEVSASKIRKSSYDYWVVAASTDLCPACDSLEEHMDRLESDVVDALDADVLAHRLHGLPDEFIDDHWPEIVRGFPTVIIIRTSDMAVIIEQVGYRDGEAYWESLQKKLDFWLANQED